MLKLVYCARIPLVVGLLLFVLTLPALKAQESGAGVLIGMGRSYQMGRAKDGINSQYIDFKSGGNSMLGAWYEKQIPGIHLQVRGLLYYMNRGYRLQQDRFMNHWTRGTSEAHTINYNTFAFQIDLGRKYALGKQVLVVPYIGIGVGYTQLDAVGGYSSADQQVSVPYSYESELVYDFDASGFATLEPNLGVRLGRSKERSWWGKLSFWANFQLAPRRLDRLGYRAIHQSGNEVVLYEGSWRSRMANWTVGLSYNFRRWNPQS